MKAIWIDQLGGAEVMQLTDQPIPEPTPKQVRVKIEAIGLNYSDIMIREGRYLQRTALPQILGREFAGVIESVGAEVNGLSVGMRVYGTVNQGALAEYVCADYRGLLPVPEGLTSDMAVALIVQGVTALHCLNEHGNLKAGETVLIHAAAGGVGTLAIQMAKAMGARVIGTASSEAKCQLIRELGAEAINYSEGDWVTELMTLTEGKGADLIIESVGGEVFLRSYREALSTFGRIIVLGIANGQPVDISTSEILKRNKAIIGYFLAVYFEKTPHLVVEAIGRLLALVENGTVKPIIGATYPLNEAAAAFDHMQGRGSVGKVVIKP
jgi:NADPH2:quinone reductase